MKFRSFLLVLRSHLLHGANSYLLFALYSLILAPIINEYLTFHEVSIPVAMGGFVILILEFVAIAFKLRMIHIRAELRKAEYLKEFNTPLVLTLPKVIYWGFFMRITLRLLIITTTMEALGFSCYSEYGQAADFTCVIAMLSVVFFDISSLGYLYVRSGVFDLHGSVSESESEDDMTLRLVGARSQSEYSRGEFYWKELVSDLVLQVYSLMVFTVLWRYINEMGLQSVKDSLAMHLTTLEALKYIFSTPVVLLLMGLMTVRIGYWIEDALHSTLWIEKAEVLLLYVISAAFILSPTITEYVSQFVLNTGSQLSFVQSTWFSTYLFGIYFLVICLLNYIQPFLRKVELTLRDIVAQ